ncbi:MAG: trypsin-like peptidase domain-containing protein [Chlamydiae bacterium]|nr:trypsin-like peptidase domain-containing protein [Chlamydiota bacterium]MBI3276487.1 trypsin-like peptidase domain-containing protein [Chlamydiota bacterium]
MKRNILITILLFFISLPLRASPLGDLENAFAEVAEKVGPAVVSISTVQTYRLGTGYLVEPYELPDQTFNDFISRYFMVSPETELHKYGLGSGIIVKETGEILTNRHVVQGASEIDVTLSDGRKFKATVKGSDSRSDLAILKIEADHLTPAQLGNSSSVKTGEWVVAIGNPFGFLLKDNQPTVTVGVISATHRKLPEAGLGQGPYYFDLIQTDAAINPGNSGGPLVNLKGEVIGINMAIFSSTGSYSGVGFAVPIDVAKEILEDLIKGDKIVYGWMGLGVGALDERMAKELHLPDSRGALVLKVFENSSSEKAGITEFDVIRKLGNIPINTPEDLIQEISRLKVGTHLKVELLRRGEALQLEVILEAHPLEREKT